MFGVQGIYNINTRLLELSNMIMNCRASHTVYTVFILYILLLRLTDSSTIDRTAIGHISILMHCILLF